MNNKIINSYGKIYTNFLKKIIMPTISLLSKNKAWRYYQQYISSEYKSVEIRRRRQWEKLINILQHAYHNVPFYKEKFDSVGIKPEDIKNEEDYHKIPVTSKQDLRNNFPHKIVAQNYRIRDLRFSNTSGTSGRPLILVHDNRDINYKYASMLRSRYLMGSEIGDKVLRIAPNECQPCLPDGSSPDINLMNYLYMRLMRHPAWRQAEYIFLERKIINPLFHCRSFPPPLKSAFKERHLDFFIKQIMDIKPDVLTGYPLYLYLIAKLIEKKKVVIKGIKAVDLTAGLSTTGLREYLERQFNAPVYQIYGGCEFGRFASSCPDSDGMMHIIDDLCYVEFIDHEGRAVQERQLGNIIVTSLTNYAMPLIRYEHGDVGWYMNEICRCGRTTRLMDVKGRLQDLIITKNGDILTTEFFFEKFLGYPGILLFQLLQRELDRYEFLIVKEEGYKLDLKKIRDILYEILGDSKIEIKFVEYIEPAPSGKYRLVKSCSYDRFRLVNKTNIPLGSFW